MNDCFLDGIASFTGIKKGIQNNVELRCCNYLGKILKSSKKGPQENIKIRYYYRSLLENSQYFWMVSLVWKFVTNFIVSLCQSRNMN